MNYSEILDSMPKYEDTTYFWFVLKNSKEAVAVMKEPCDTCWKDRPSCHLYIEDDKLVVTESHMQKFEDESYVNILLSDWDIFINRPEYHAFSESVVADPSEEYFLQFIGSRLAKEFKTDKNPDAAIPKISRCLEWLSHTDFFIAPASTQYHDSFEGGLLRHSLKVSDRALELLQSSAFAGYIAPEDAVFVSLVHDWCKIGLYKSYIRNVKDDRTNQWNKVTAYKYVDDRTICLGHGVSSLYLIMKFFTVSVEEAAAIRWHMGRWNCVDAELNELQQANRNYPLVHLLQFADQLAITSY